MTRPHDWWVLDLEGDPTPGSPAAVRRMARTWSQVADDAAWAERRVRQLMGDEALGRWIGEAGDKFRSKTGDLPDQLGKCADSYGQASDALSWWAGRLEVHQGDADDALARGRIAHEELEDARRQASAAASAVSSASGVPALNDPSLNPTPDQIRDARSRLSSAQAARSSADAAVSAAQSRLDAARRLALDAKHLRENDGRTAADRIHEAADAGIPERSRWEKFKDWAGEAWDVIITIAKVVVAVLGVIALIIGGPLAWVVFAAALLILADTIMKYMKGEASLWEVGLAALACIPGTKGLTSLSALRAEFAAGGMLQAGLHILSSGKTALAEMAAATRALGSQIRTTTVLLADRAIVRLRATPALLRGVRSMVQSDFGVMGTLRGLPDLLRVPVPDEGMRVYRIFGEQLESSGRPFLQPGKDYAFGSRPSGASWTPTEIAPATDFRVEAGLPDQNPARFLAEGDLVDVSQVREIRLALPLDGNPGGFPEYIIEDAGNAVDLTGVSGVNAPWTMGPGEYKP